MGFGRRRLPYRGLVGRRMRRFAHVDLLQGEYRRIWNRFRRRRFPEGGGEAIKSLLTAAQITKSSAGWVAELLDDQWQAVWKNQRPAEREIKNTMKRFNDAIRGKALHDQEIGDTPF